MNEITENLYLGSWDSATNYWLRNMFGIVAHLNVCREIGFKAITGIDYLHVTLPDHAPFNKELIEQMVDFIDVHAGLGYPTLVSCLWGMSRSPAVVICYLMKKKLYSFDEAYALVKEKRPTINISPIIIDSIKLYFGVENVK